MKNAHISFAVPGLMYEELRPITRAEYCRLFESGSSGDAGEALLGLAWHEIDTFWAEQQYSAAGQWPRRGRRAATTEPRAPCAAAKHSEPLNPAPEIGVTDLTIHANTFAGGWNWGMHFTTRGNPVHMLTVYSNVFRGMTGKTIDTENRPNASTKECALRDCNFPASRTTACARRSAC